MSVSIDNTESFISELEQYYYSRAMMFKLAEMRKNVREYIYYLNGNTIMTTPIIEDRFSFLRDNVYS